MGFLKKLVKGAGNFAKKVATSGIGKTVLGAAATVVGGPAAGALVSKATSLLGESKVGEMASKVVNDGTVKVDKVQSTLQKIVGSVDPNTVSDVVSALKYSAQGIGSKPITVTKSGFVDSSTSGTSTVGNITDKVKSTWYKLKTWVVENKKVVLIGLGVIAAAVLAFFMFGKKTKYRR